METNKKLTVDSVWDLVVDEVNDQLEATIDNNGIGSYEFWGAKCFDAGHDYATAEDTTVVVGNGELTEEVVPAEVTGTKKISGNCGGDCDRCRLHACPEDFEVDWKATLKEVKEGKAVYEVVESK